MLLFFLLRHSQCFRRLDCEWLDVSPPMALRGGSICVPLAPEIERFRSKELGCSGLSPVVAAVDCLQGGHDVAEGNCGIKSRITLCVQHHIVHRHDSLQSGIVINHRKAPDFSFAHMPQRRVDIIVCLANASLTIDDIPYTQFGGRHVPCPERDAEIAVSNHSRNRSGLIENRKDAAIVFPHQRGCFRQVRIQAASRDRFRHYFFNCHG